MEWNKRRIRDLLALAGGISAVVNSVVVAFAVTDANGMISYYCAAANPFLGFRFEGYALCPIYVTVGLVFLITFAILLGSFIAAVLLASIIGVLKRTTGIGRAKNYSYNYAGFDKPESNTKQESKKAPLILESSHKLYTTFVIEGHYASLRVENIGEGEIRPIRNSSDNKESQMAWKTPKIVEVPVGMEINMYACAARK